MPTTFTIIFGLGYYLGLSINYCNREIEYLKNLFYKNTNLNLLINKKYDSLLIEITELKNKLKHDNFIETKKDTSVCVCLENKNLENDVIDYKHDNDNEPEYEFLEQNNTIDNDIVPHVRKRGSSITDIKWSDITKGFFTYS